MEENKLRKLSTREKISLKLSSIQKSKTKSSLFLILAWRNGNCKKTHLQFHTNPQKSTNCKSYILISMTSHTPSVHKPITFFAGRNLKNAQSTTSLLKKSKELSKWTRHKSVFCSKPLPVDKKKMNTMFLSTTRWKSMI